MTGQEANLAARALLVVLAAGLLAGCGDDSPPGWVKTREAAMAADERHGLVCVNDNSASGNVCRVKTDKGWCVAVLPDGGKSPKGYKDFTTCPEAKR